MTILLGTLAIIGQPLIEAWHSLSSLIKQTTNLALQGGEEVLIRSFIYY